MEFNVPLLLDLTQLESMDGNSTLSTVTFTSTEAELIKMSWTPQNIARVIICILISLTTITANLTLLILLLGNRKLRSIPRNYFIINLAIADLLVGLFIEPLLIATFANAGRWHLGISFCVMWQTWNFWFCSASLLFLSALSIDLCVGITRPLRYIVIMTRRRCWLLIAGVWIFSFSTTALPFLLMPEERMSDGNYCMSTTKLETLLTTVLAVFFLPALLVLFAYYRIWRVVRQRLATEFCKKGLRGIQLPGGGGGGADGGNGLRIHRGGPAGGTIVTTSQHIESLRFRSHSKAAKTLTIIVGTYIICWGPTFIMLVCIAFSSSFSILDGVMDYFLWLGLANSCLNPFIYALSSRKLKQALKKMISCRRKDKKSNLNVNNANINNNNNEVSVVVPNIHEP